MFPNVHRRWRCAWRANYSGVMFTPSCDNGSMSTTELATVASLSQQIVTEADAYIYMEDLRWADGPRCAHCDEIDVYLIVPTNGTSRKTAGGNMSERRVWKCRRCRKQFSVLTGTIMHASKIPVRTWVLVMFDMRASKNGISAREVGRQQRL
jgi:transposase-like protein